jgi:hypothetical protein
MFYDMDSETNARFKKSWTDEANFPSVWTFSEAPHDFLFFTLYLYFPDSIEDMIKGCRAWGLGCPQRDQDEDSYLV